MHRSNSGGANESDCTSVFHCGRRRLFAAPAFAVDLPTKKPAPAPIPEPVLPSTRHVDMTAYLWATSLAGNTGVGTFPTNPFFYSFGDILRHFEGAFMGTIIARNDTFMGALDLIWTRVE